MKPDDEEFGAFYRKHRSLVLAHVRATARAVSFSEAELDYEGIVQDTFVAAHRQWSSICSAPEWLRGVAGNKVRAAGNKVVKQKDALLQAALRLMRRHGDPNPVHTKALVNAIIKMIDDLPPRQREAIYLRLVEDRSTTEIAELMGITTGAVAAHVHNGKATLARRMRSFFGWLFGGGVTSLVVGLGNRSGDKPDTRIDAGAHVPPDERAGAGHGSDTRAAHDQAVRELLDHIDAHVATTGVGFGEGSDSGSTGGFQAGWSHGSDTRVGHGGNAGGGYRDVDGRGLGVGHRLGGRDGGRDDGHGGGGGHRDDGHGGESGGGSERSD